MSKALVRLYHRSSSIGEYSFLVLFITCQPHQQLLAFSCIVLVYMPDPSLVENIRSLGIGVNLPRKRTHRGDRRKQRRIQVLSRHTADPVAVPPPDFDLCAGPDFNNLISIPLSLRPKSTPADTLRVALFNARPVNDPLKRAEISTFISDNQVDILFLTGCWLRQQVDEAKFSDLTSMGYPVCSFPRPSRGGDIAVVYSDTLARCLISTSLLPFHHPSFEAARIS